MSFIRSFYTFLFFHIHFVFDYQKLTWRGILLFPGREQAQKKQVIMNFKNVKTATTKIVKHRSSFLLIYNLEKISHSKKQLGHFQPTLFFTSCFPMLFIAFNSPNLVHQHWKEKKTTKSPKNFDLDSRGGGGTPRMKGVEMVVGNLELNP